MARWQSTSFWKKNGAVAYESIFVAIPVTLTSDAKNGLVAFWSNPGVGSVPLGWAASPDLSAPSVV